MGWRENWGREDVQVVGDSPVREKTGKKGIGKEEWNGTRNREDSREDGREGAGNREGGRECEIGKRKSEGQNYDRRRGRRDVFLGGVWRREIGEEGEGRGGDEREVSSWPVEGMREIGEGEPGEEGFAGSGAERKIGGI